MEENHPESEYKEYGISKTYWRNWGGYSEPITEEEYEFALNFAKAVEYIRRAGSAHAGKDLAKKEGISATSEVWHAAFWEAEPFMRS